MQSKPQGRRLSKYRLRYPQLTCRCSAQLPGYPVHLHTSHGFPDILANDFASDVCSKGPKFLGSQNTGVLMLVDLDVDLGRLMSVGAVADPNARPIRAARLAKRASTSSRR